MAALLANLWPFAVYWLILFVACYIVVEYGQTYLYDETTPGVGWKVALGSALLAALLAWTRTSYDTMLTSEFIWTTLQAIAWFAVFTLIFRFHPLHAFAIGVVTMLLISGMATLGVTSLTRRGGPVPPPIRTPSKPLRRPAGPSVKDLGKQGAAAPAAKAK